MSDVKQETNAEDVKQPSEVETFAKTVESKFSSTDEKINSLLSSQQALINALTASKVQKEPEVDTQQIADMIYTKPEEAISLIEQKVEKKLEKKFSDRDNVKDQSRQILAELVNDFPELTDTNSDLYKTAVDIYAALPEYTRNLPTSYETAVYKAATKIGLSVKSKRVENTKNKDDFSLSGTSNGSRSNKNKDLNPDLLRFAKMVGKDPNDSKYLDSLKKYVK